MLSTSLKVLSDLKNVNFVYQYTEVSSTNICYALWFIFVKFYRFLTWPSSAEPRSSIRFMFLKSFSLPTSQKRGVFVVI